GREGTGACRPLRGRGGASRRQRRPRHRPQRGPGRRLLGPAQYLGIQTESLTPGLSLERATADLPPLTLPAPTTQGIDNGENPGPTKAERRAPVPPRLAEVVGGRRGRLLPVRLDGGPCGQGGRRPAATPRLHPAVDERRAQPDGHL